MPVDTTRSLRLSVLDGLLYAVMVGVAESYLGAFAVDLGLGDTALAMLATVPLLVGALSQLATPLWVRLLGSRQRGVVAGAALQVVSLLWMMGIALSGDDHFANLLGAKALFWFGGGVITPAWNAWMGTLTADVHRERYFARRSALLHLALLGAFMLGGVLLEGGADRYPLLFGLAALARTGSAVVLARKSDPGAVAPGGAPARVWPRMRRALAAGHFRTAIFIALLMFGAQISVPFFTPYMFRTLGLSKLGFAALISASILAKSLAFPVWREVAERRGMRQALIVSTGLVCLLPAFWTLTRGFPELVGLQIVSGVAWGGFEYLTLQLLLRDAPGDADVEFFALANSLSGLLQLAGSAVGGLILARGDVPYETVFLASSAMRGVALGVLVLGGLRLPFRGPMRALVTRVLSVRPGAGVVLRLVPPSEPRETDDEA